MLNDIASETASSSSGNVTRLSSECDTATPHDVIDIPQSESTDWYLANVNLPPTTPVNLGRSTEVFEIQSAFSDIDSLASWYQTNG